MTQEHRFYKWIIKKTAQDNPLGDLARDIVSDVKYPMYPDLKFPVDLNREIKGNYLNQLHSYLRSMNACKEAHTALDEAWDLHKSRRPKRDVSLGLRFKIFKQCDYSCQICGATSKDGRLEVDHIVPVAKGGTNEPDNLWILCFDCNRGKRTKNL